MSTKATSATRAASPGLVREWVIDRDQHPDQLIEHHRLTNLNNPEVHAAYARTVRDKVAAGGLIHVDINTGYRARFHPGHPPAENGAGA